jgi:Tol biopolymer transport system component
MKSGITALVLFLAVLPRAVIAQPRLTGNPEEHLPQAITQLSGFGERAVWSPDGTRIAWANTRGQYPDSLAEGESVIYMADVTYDSAGTPTLANRRELLRARRPACTLEAQDFRRDDAELVYVCYREGDKADVFGLDIATGRSTTYRKVEGEYNEVEGVSPDGAWALVESSREQGGPERQTSRFIDLWKLTLVPNGGAFVRMTRWGDYEGYKASNPTVSPDGKWFAFQSARNNDPAGVGYGIFLYRLGAK